MKRTLTFSMAVLMLVIATGYAHATMHMVSIQNFAFSPADLTIGVGDTVLWTNLDGYPHTVTAANNLFDSGNLNTNDTFTYTFSAAGTFAYVCAYHSNMTGSIIVERAAMLYEVAIMNFAFDPASLQIQVGDSVRWTNADAAPHTVTEAGGAFDSGNLTTGQSFTHVFTSAGSYPYVCLYHSNMSGVINVGDTSQTVSNWTELTSPTSQPLTDARFWSADIGWMSGEQGVARTTDGGANWSMVNTPDDAEAVYFISANEGWLCGNNGMLRHSTDGGAQWTAQTSNVFDKLRDIWFADALHGWSVGRNGLLIYTSDGGQTWNPQTSPATDDLRGIHMLDDQEGWISGSDGLILYTENGGANWVAQLSVPDGEEDEFEAVFALDDQHVWAAGGMGRIYATTNGGVNWAAQTSGTMMALMDIFFVNADTGWVCGAGGFLAMTTDGGQNWNVQSTPVSPTFNAIYFVNNAPGYLAGGDGSMLKLAGEETPSGVTTSPPGVVHELTLAAAYPNPFNPTTTIEFTVGSAGPVRLQIYDILGQSVATLINGNLQPGAYHTQFNGTGLSSGLYFYRLEAGRQVRTRTMTLLK